MILPEYRRRISAAGIPAIPVVLEKSALFECARQAGVMICSYLDDGDRFLAAGDLKNCLASYSYALGWHDSASFFGLFLPGPVLDGAITESLRDIPAAAELVVKREKYADMLTRALGHTRPSPDPESCMYPCAVYLMQGARSALNLGNVAISMGNNPGALSWYSYGHGWLDLGVRVGILIVTGERHLFAI